MSNAPGWIGFDLDGTLAQYDKWRGPDHIGEPIPDAVALVRRYIEAGTEVRVFTARVSRNGDHLGEGIEIARIRGLIEAWCERHVGQRLPVTNVKDYGMLLLYDDRAVRVVRNTGVPCCLQYLHDDHYGLPRGTR